MSWKISRLSSSLMGLLREREPVHSAAARAQMERIREEMLACMAAYLPSKATRPPVWNRVLEAQDMQALWYLRSDVMHLLSAHCGETLAADKIDALTEWFRGHLPAAQFASARRRA